MDDKTLLHLLRHRKEYYTKFKPRRQRCFPRGQCSWRERREAQQILSMVYRHSQSKPKEVGENATVQGDYCPIVLKQPGKVYGPVPIILKPVDRSKKVYFQKSDDEQRTTLDDDISLHGDKENTINETIKIFKELTGSLSKILASPLESEVEQDAWPANVALSDHTYTSTEVTNEDSICQYEDLPLDQTVQPDVTRVDETLIVENASETLLVHPIVIEISPADDTMGDDKERCDEVFESPEDLRDANVTMMDCSLQKSLEFVEDNKQDFVTTRRAKRTRALKRTHEFEEEELAKTKKTLITRRKKTSFELFDSPDDVLVASMSPLSPMVEEDELWQTKSFINGAVTISRLSQQVDQLSNSRQNSPGYFACEPVSDLGYNGGESTFNTITHNHPNPDEEGSSLLLQQQPTHDELLHEFDASEQNAPLITSDLNDEMWSENEQGSFLNEEIEQNEYDESVSLQQDDDDEIEPSHVNVKRRRVGVNARANVKFPVRQIAKRLKAATCIKVWLKAAIYLAGVLDYLVQEVLDLANTVVTQRGRKIVQPKDINVVLKCDQELFTLTKNAILPGVNIPKPTY